MGTRRGGARAAGLFVCVALAGAAGCGDDERSAGGGPPASGIDGGGGEAPPQCREDADCAIFDVDGDACKRVRCTYGACRQELIRGTAECQCHNDDDCDVFDGDCSAGRCEAHRCEREVFPAGPSPKDVPGDCSRLTCDGTAAPATREDDAADLPDDANPCTVDGCDTFGPTHADVADGTPCSADGAFCFQGRCMACVPRDPTSCAGEGPGEPANDDPATAATIVEYQPFCAYSSGSDVDWYTFEADDGFGYDVLRFRFHSNAASMEVCVYAVCSNGGEPMGGCATKLPGPGNSLGCCWTGAPNDLAPTWDLDCSGTTEDEGTIYVSVRTPGADACRYYAMSGGY